MKLKVMEKLNDVWVEITLPTSEEEKDFFLRGCAGREIIIEMITNPYIDPDDPEKGTIESRDFYCGTEQIMKQMINKFKDSKNRVMFSTGDQVFALDREHNPLKQECFRIFSQETVAKVMPIEPMHKANPNWWNDREAYEAARPKRRRGKQA